MNPEFYIYDTCGIYHKKNVFSKEAIDNINAKIDNSFKNDGDNSFKHEYATVGRDTSFVDESYLELILHPEIKKICSVSFDSESYNIGYSFVLNEDKPKKINNDITLHGQAYGFQSSWYYNSYAQNHIKTPCVTHVGQLSVGIVLKPQDAKTGGFCYLPGSHKASYTISGGESLSTPEYKECIKRYINIPNLEPGDIIAFPENLIHGSCSSLLPRRMLYTMFFPYGVYYGYNHENLQKLREIAKPEDLIHLQIIDSNNTMMDIHKKVNNNQNLWNRPKNMYL